MIKVKYPGYTVTIPENLAKPFKVLASILEYQDVGHPCELLDSDASSDTVHACMTAVTVAIGAQYGGSDDINTAVKEWTTQDYFEKLICLINAVKSAQPYNYADVLMPADGIKPSK